VLAPCSPSAARGACARGLRGQVGVVVIGLDRTRVGSSSRCTAEHCQSLGVVVNHVSFALGRRLGEMHITELGVQTSGVAGPEARQRLPSLGKTKSSVTPQTNPQKTTLLTWSLMLVNG
jgi:hypothetical protein